MIAIAFGIGMYLLSIWLLMFGYLVQVLIFVSIVPAVAGTIACIHGLRNANPDMKSKSNEEKEDSSEKNEEKSE